MKHRQPSQMESGRATGGRAPSSEVGARSSWGADHPALLGRLVAVAGIIFIVDPFAMSGRFFDTLSAPEAVAWVRSATGAVSVQGISVGFGSVLLAGVLLYLLWITRVRDVLAVSAALALSALVAIDWLAASVYFGLADVATREGSDAAVLALFSLAKMTTFADGVSFGLALTLVCVLALRTRSMAAPLAWFGILVGVWHLVELPVQLAVSQTADGSTGPISAVSGLIWLLAVSLTLLVRPVRHLAVPNASVVTAG